MAFLIKVNSNAHGVDVEAIKQAAESTGQGD
jgi:hypothetical protein